jgi:hypothetical protein
MSTPEEDKAREVAEARQRRIREGAKNRMGLIEGFPAGDAPDTANDDEDADADAGDGDADADGAIVVGADVVPKKASAGAARMAAMRRRRLNKGKAVAAAAAETETPAATDETCPAPAATDEPADDDDKSKTDATTATEFSAVTEISATTTTPTKEEESTDIATSQEDSEKKYMGVAKMRRKKLMEKKLQEAQNEAPQVLSAALKKKKKSKSFLDRLPILMHAVTVLLLFVAGLDIGMQQHHDYGDDLIVHADFAPRQHGLQIVQKMKVPSFITKMMEKKAVVEKMIVDGKESQEDVPVIDEFADNDKIDDTPDNLDPLFGHFGRQTARQGQGRKDENRCHEHGHEHGQDLYLGCLSHLGEYLRWLDASES